MSLQSGCGRSCSSVRLTSTRAAGDAALSHAPASHPDRSAVDSSDRTIINLASRAGIERFNRRTSESTRPVAFACQAIEMQVTAIADSASETMNGHRNGSCYCERFDFGLARCKLDTSSMKA